MLGTKAKKDIIVLYIVGSWLSQHRHHHDRHHGEVSDQDLRECAVLVAASGDLLSAATFQLTAAWWHHLLLLTPISASLFTQNPAHKASKF